MQNEIWTIGKALDWTVGYLGRVGLENPRLISQILLADAAGVDRLGLYLNYDKPLTATERETFRNYVSRAAQHEPVQYILGKAPFRDLEIYVEPGVLIPRPETELLVEEVLTYLKTTTESATESMLPASSKDNTSNHEYLIADVCTGSGCIAASISAENPATKVYALDIDPKACEVAQKNISLLELDDRVKVMRSNLLGAFFDGKDQEKVKFPEIKFDVIVSNPPYIPTAELQTLSAEVKTYEPMLALDGGEDGLCFLSGLAVEAKKLLKPGGLLAIELHETKLEEARDFVVNCGFSSAEIKQDLAGKPRILLAWL